jgi:hypothetical protein
MTTLNQQEQNATNQNHVERASNITQLVRGGDAVAQQTQVNPLPNNMQVARTYQSMQFCTITLDVLYIRTTPYRWSAPVDELPRGTVLNFVEVVNGEMVDGNPLWGHSAQGHYYWMGGTDRPNG